MKKKYIDATIVAWDCHSRYHYNEPLRVNLWVFLKTMTQFKCLSSVFITFRLQFVLTTTTKQNLNFLLLLSDTYIDHLYFMYIISGTAQIIDNINFDFYYLTIKIVCIKKCITTAQFWHWVTQQTFIIVLLCVY